MVLLTSGTTGTPKGAPRDRIGPLQTAQVLDRIPLPANSTYFLAAPMFHATGLALASLGLAMGNTVVLQRRFDAEATLRQVEKYRVEVLVLVPTMLQRIVDLGPEVLGRYSYSSLRIVFVAGSSLPPDLCKRATQIFGDVLYNLYGSIEVAVATAANPDDLGAAPGTVGYFDDDGLWFVVGRDDDMIISGGENVYPLEVENLLTDRADADGIRHFVRANLAR